MKTDGNLTDEYSDLSAALDDDEEIMESGRVSPATEDELMSDHLEYEGNPHPKPVTVSSSSLGANMLRYPPEFILPSPRKKVISLKENKDGTSTKEVQVDYMALLTPSFRRVSTIKSSLYHICLMFMLEGVNSH